MREEIVAYSVRLPVLLFAIIMTNDETNFSSVTICIVHGALQPFFIIGLQCTVNEFPNHKKLMVISTSAIVTTFVTLYSLLIHFSLVSLTVASLAFYILSSDIVQILVTIATNV